eukprot:g1418.t1
MEINKNRQNFNCVAGAYCTVTLCDGALRTIVLLHANNLGFDALEISIMFVLYELMGVVTNLVGGFIASRVGLKCVCFAGLCLQSVSFFLIAALNYIFGNDFSDSHIRLGAIAFLTFTQALAGVSKDLLKISGKSITKLVNKEESACASDRLFKMVAYLTGAKNSIKGIGLFLGGVVLIDDSNTAYVVSCFCIGILPLFTLPFIILYVDESLGKTSTDTTQSIIPWREIFSAPQDICVLSASRFWLFGSRDIWFEVAAPIFLKEVLNWDDYLVSAFLGGYIIIYGKLQVLSRNLVLKPLGCNPPNAFAVLPWTTALCILSAFIGCVYYMIHKNSVGDIIDAWIAQENFDDDQSFKMPQKYSDIVHSLSVATPILFVGFAVIMAIISAIHSYLVVAYSPKNSVAKNVGFYYMANAGGRLIGTLLSGILYKSTVHDFGISLCCWIAAAFLAVSVFCAYFLQPLDENREDKNDEK